MRRARRLAGLTLVAAWASFAPGAAAADPSPSRLRKAIDAIVARPEFASAFWGIEVRSLASGRTLYARNAEKAFRPASSLKLVTTAAALDAFGPDARVLTTLETEGRLDGLGRILGDVFLVGRGDPDLSARFTPGRPTAAFEAMADALVAAGVRRIEGRLVGHEGAFTGERRGSDWTWEDLAWGYGTEVSALSWSDNLVEVSLGPGERVGDPALLEAVPDAGCLAVSSSVTTAEAAAPGAPPAGEDDEVSLDRAPGSNEVRLEGRVPLGGSWDAKLAVVDPARCAAAAFLGVVEAKGIRVTGGVATSSLPLPPGARVLATHESPPMGEMIRVVNKESQNLHAEMLLRLVGLKVLGVGSAARGHEAIAALAKRLDVPDEGWGLVDGSGLARTDLVTPRGLTALLVAMDRHPHAASFRASLPVAGRDGTLEKRMRGTAAEGRVLAKTGSLRLANALAGYVTTARGRAPGVRARGEQPRGEEPRGGGRARRHRARAGGSLRGHDEPCARRMGSMRQTLEQADRVIHRDRSKQLELRSSTPPHRGHASRALRVIYDPPTGWSSLRFFGAIWAACILWLRSLFLLDSPSHAGQTATLMAAGPRLTAGGWRRATRPGSLVTLGGRVIKMKFKPSSGTAKAITLVALSLLVALLALPGSTYAQSLTGSISGSVVDESGGVIPGADVTVINEASKGVRRTVTNADGFFAFASLPATTYTVQISIAGFNTYEVTGLELRSGDSRSLRQIALKVATVAETVSVSAEVALTPLNSGEKSATLTSEQIENVPIMGTSAAEVLRLLPGMTGSSNGTSNKPSFSGEVYGINGNGEGGQQSAVGNYSANGNRTWALDITIDGAPGADPGCNCATSVNPNTEFVQEFKVLQSNFSAEHAKGPVAMSVISKSGGRDFHGSVFGYFRDYKLNSNEWFANKVGAERVKNKFTYPGFTLSGPLLIPGTDFNKNRDKVFFFVGYEYFGQALDTGYVKSWVPTNEMRAGNFANAAAVGSGSFVNTVPNFPGGIVPANQIDPGGQALLNMFQQPNADPATTGGYNYVDNLVIDQNGWQGLAPRRLQPVATTRSCSCATTSSARRSPSRSASGGATASASSRTRPRSAGRTAPTRSRPASPTCSTRR